ncbi:MAG: hypothetical protein AAF957_24860 [Planctomycetota bacterium]
MALHLNTRRPSAAGVAGSLALAAAALASAAAAATPAPQALPAEIDSEIQAGAKSQDDPPTEVEFADLTFSDATSRAERLERILVVLWVDGAVDSQKGEKLRSAMFDDMAVVRWMAEYGVAVRIDGSVDKKGVRSNKVTAFPAVDLIDLRRGGRVERFLPGSNSADFLAAVYGLEQEGEEMERPTGIEANEPFRWLAWANGRYRRADETAAEDAASGYRWCLLNADQFRPGFRARYLEFLLKRISYLKQRTYTAIAVINSERDRLAAKMMRGEATQREVYELTRVDFWRRKHLETRDLYVKLGGLGTTQERYRQWLFYEVVPELAQWEQYQEILDVLGDDAVGLFSERIAMLERQAQADRAAAKGPAEENGAEEDGAQGPSAEGTAKAEGPTAPHNATMEYTVPDDRGRIIVEASWVYEALLASGRGADAKALLAFMAETYPLGKTYGLFMERALRLKLWSLAAEIADTGMAVVDERGQRRLQRLLGKIPVDGEDDDTDGR